MAERRTPRISKVLMAALVEFITDNLPVLIDAEGPIDVFFSEMFVLIEDELERAVQEDRRRRFTTSDN